jgi:hypothetical protein
MAEVLLSAKANVDATDAVMTDLKEGLREREKARERERQTRERRKCQGLRRKESVLRDRQAQVGEDG